MKNENQENNVERECGELTFAHPSFRGTYAQVAEAIDNAGLQRPTSAQTASLVYGAFQNPGGEYESGIKDILRSNWFWEFTGNLYLPKEPGAEVHGGVLIEDNPEIVSGRISMDKQSLIKRLKDQDPSVRFAPFGFKTEDQSVKDLEKNPYMVARYGKEGAQKIAEVASKYSFEPSLWSFYSVIEEFSRVSSLSDCWGDVGRLNVVGDLSGSGDYGHSFGVRTPENNCSVPKWNKESVERRSH